MNKIYIILLFLVGCASHKQPIIESTLISSAISSVDVSVKPVEYQPGQIKKITHPTVRQINTGYVLEQALHSARQKPQPQRFLNAITMYDFIPGSVYQIYTAPQKVTMISFADGEQIVSAPQSGDTARWQVNTILSGSGNTAKQHLILKPLREGLTNNMIVTTNQGRVYLLELISFKNSYMLDVAWNYSTADADIAEYTVDSKTEIPRQLNFNYKIINKKGNPSWRPTQVFDDGEKTYIQFPGSVTKQELPTLFIVSKESDNQLVNYRQQNNCLVVDRLFKQAELKLGLKNPEIVRIKKL